MSICVRAEFIDRYINRFAAAVFHLAKRDNKPTNARAVGNRISDESSIEISLLPDVVVSPIILFTSCRPLMLLESAWIGFPFVVCRAFPKNILGTLWTYTIERVLRPRKTYIRVILRIYKWIRVLHIPSLELNSLTIFQVRSSVRCRKPRARATGLTLRT